MRRRCQDQTHQKPFENLAEAISEFPNPGNFRSALVDDVHFNRGRFALLSPRELLEGCDVAIGSLDDFCISQVPSNRTAFKNSDSGWAFI